VTQNFSVPKVNVVQSDAGYTVEVIPRTHIRYTEGARTMLIDSEPLIPDGTMALYTSSMEKWDPPHNGQPLDATERARIVENIRAAFDFMGWILDPD
jgi:hypothetical protein